MLPKIVASIGTHGPRQADTRRHNENRHLPGYRFGKRLKSSKLPGHTQPAGQRMSAADGSPDTDQNAGTDESGDEIADPAGQNDAEHR